MHELTRRGFTRGLATGALIAGFNPVTRQWVTGAPGQGPFAHVPPLDGKLFLDQSTLLGAADDFGHIVHHMPRAVLQPGSVKDVVVMVRFCYAHALPVAARGAGHATYGQAQADGGLVIEMDTLDSVSVAQNRAVAEAGAKWSKLLAAALPAGLTPPVFTDYIELSVGGTLSAGGLGGTSQHYGAQVDNVAELEVVTGKGELTTCSPMVNPGLFHAVLAGLGQCAVVVRATIRLVPAPASVRHYMLLYPSVAALTADQRRVAGDGRFSFVEGGAQAATDGSGGWVYYLEAGAYYGTTPPDDMALIGDLTYERGTEQIESVGYADFINRLAPAVAFLESTGEWYDPHPWWNVFLPGTVTDDFVTSVMDGLSIADIGASGVILLYPLRRALLAQPLTRVPAERLVFLFSLLRTAAPDTGAAPAAALIQANTELYRRARAAGGYQYPVGSIPMTPADWRAHFGPVWPLLAEAKRRYDPRGILTPGQGIFSGPATH